MPPVEFDCEGCGQHVVSLGHDGVPAHGLCAVCAWLCENVPDPAEMMRMRVALGLVSDARPQAQKKAGTHTGTGLDGSKLLGIRRTPA